jgi:hypothetical protein
MGETRVVPLGIEIKPSEVQLFAEGKKLLPDIHHAQDATDYRQKTYLPSCSNCCSKVDNVHVLMASLKPWILALGRLILLAQGNRSNRNRLFNAKPAQTRAKECYQRLKAALLDTYTALTNIISANSDDRHQIGQRKESLARSVLLGRLANNFV